MRTYKTATTKPIPEDARYSTRGGVKYVTAVVSGKRVTGKVTEKGMRVESPYYTLQFKDNQGKLRNVLAYTNQVASVSLGEKIKNLMIPGADVNSLIQDIPERIKSKLVAFGIISDQFTAQSLTDLIDKYSEWMKSTRAMKHGLNRCEKYCSNTKTMLNKIIDGCGFKRYSDINVVVLEIYLGKLKVKSATYNQNVIAIKGFCKWVVKGKFAAYNAASELGYITDADDKQERRAFTTDEVFRLLEVTQAAPRRFELNGDQRVLMYLIAVQTGLRKSEILSLKTGSFDLDRAVVKLPREFAKNRKKIELPIRRNFIAILRRYLIKYPGPKLFPRDASFRAAEMIKADLKNADIPLETNEGIACFHSLRHTCSTNLDETSATWVQVKTLMRHSMKKDITAQYTKTITIEKLRPIVEQLPDFEYSKRDKAVG